MANKIANPKKEVPAGIELNDLDYMTLLLTYLKDIEKNMTVALTEASNQKLYKKYKEMFDSIANTMRLAYELMFQYGWYSLELAEGEKIKTTYKDLTTKLNKLDDLDSPDETEVADDDENED